MAEHTNSTLRRKTRYTAGGVTEVNPQALEWWERTPLPKSPDDRLYTVERKYAGRLDLIAAMYLGEPRYWWVLAQYNSILDPYSEVVEGARIFIPTASRVDTMLGGGKTGGVPSEREVPISILPIV